MDNQIAKIISEIKERLAKSTPGPWENSNVTIMAGQKEVCECYSTEWDDLSDELEANAELIASAPTDLKKLIEVVDVLASACEFYGEKNKFLKEVTYPGGVKCEGYKALFSIRNDHGDKAREALRRAEEILR